MPFDSPFLVIYSDLDGSLLDHDTYGAGPAAAVIARLSREQIPLVLCSSKTRAEIDEVRGQYSIRHPFTCENGGAVVVPAGYFPFALDGARSMPGCDLIEFGRPYSEVVATLRRVSERLGIRAVGFHEMTAEAIAADSGLSLAAAALARQREYDEAFRVADGSRETATRLCQALEGAGLRCTTGGRYLHAASPGVDKGVAVAALSRLYRRVHGSLWTVGLGDGINDAPLLAAVDLPIVVRNPAAQGAGELARVVPNAQVTELEGPAGWASAVSGVLDARRRRAPGGGPSPVA